MSTDTDIAILGPRGGDQVEAVARELEARGVDPTLWDSSVWPGPGTPVAVRQTETGTEIEIEGDAPDVGAVYIRDYGLNPIDHGHRETLEERPYSFLNQLREYRGLTVSAMRLLERRGVRMINSTDVGPIHSQKPHQLGVLAEADVPVPETLSTNDPGAIEAFVERVGDAIYKPVSGGGHAREVGPEDLDPDRLELIANSPVQFQERYNGDDLRIFVLDGEVTAAARLVAESLDYRADDHDVEPVDLDDAIERTALRAADQLGLTFAGVDVVDEGDRFAVLEANPSPMFAGFDALADTNVAGELAEVLIRAR